MTPFVNTDIPSGFRGTEATITVMHRLVNLAVSGVGPDGEPDDSVIRLAQDVVRGIAAKDHVGEAAALLLHVQKSVRYTLDPWTPTGGVERVQHPVVTLLRSKAGDCDDAAVAFSALGAAIGLPWAFRTVGVDPLDPNAFVHVYSLVHIAGKWVAADPSFAEAVLGWEPPLDDPRLSIGQVRLGPQRVFTRDWAPS